MDSEYISKKVRIVNNTSMDKHGFDIGDKVLITGTVYHEQFGKRYRATKGGLFSNYLITKKDFVLLSNTIKKIEG